MSMWTAYASLFESAETKPGAVVVVHGGTSSVGIWAILLAKDRGCTVIATTRQPGKLDRLRAAGADHALLDDESLVSKVRSLYPKGVNTVFELVGPDKLEKVAFPMLARHGACVVSGILTKVWALHDFTPAMIPPTRKLCFFTCLTGEDIEGAEEVLQDVINKVESGVFKKEVYLDKVFKLEDIGKAHEYMEENKAVGKVVVTIDQQDHSTDKL
ncbi:NAD P-binding protein [Gloeophyllum trabeum ATCC 11539]|uniref:NAD P-binding protein n=1 Tax=Gloeophyllum trabeum (strain ATCC 11539 / FP-39264 / Madison 617) TaxID=670483 RepID=S7Q8T9_GLOTA|nr:NAD P-binding protein [Gloeophyllum trabeum ATCC 11539]EPQ55843.1 NAD P-binding protein [Gloeophyllum trabeum ATCC 11539]